MAAKELKTIEAIVRAATQGSLDLHIICPNAEWPSFLEIYIFQKLRIYGLPLATNLNVPQRSLHTPVPKTTVKKVTDTYGSSAAYVI